MKLKLERPELEAFLAAEFPQLGQAFQIADLAPMRATIRMTPEEAHLRPGGTVSGPSMFALADVGVYIAVLAMIGPKALAVTTSCSIDFMRKPAAGQDLVADVRLLKLGRLLAVGDVLIHSEGQEGPVARSSMTYAIPPEPVKNGNDLG